MVLALCKAKTRGTVTQSSYTGDSALFPCASFRWFSDVLGTDLSEEGHPLMLPRFSLALLNRPRKIRGAESMVMRFHGNVRGEVRVNFLALFASKPHIFMCGALKLSGVARANVRLP